MEGSELHVKALQVQQYLKALVKGSGSQPGLLMTRVTRSHTTCGQETPSGLGSGTQKRGLPRAGWRTTFCATWPEARS